MSTDIDLLIPPCPPPREIKSAKPGNKRTTRVRAVDFDNDDNEDDYIKPQKRTKRVQKGRKPVINNFDENDEEEEEEEPQQKKRTTNKKSPAKKNKKYTSQINEDENDEEEDEDEDDYYQKRKPQTQKKKTSKRPQTSKNTSTSQKRKQAYYNNYIEEEEESDPPIDDYENYDNDDFEEQLISNHKKNKITIPRQKYNQDSDENNDDDYEEQPKSNQRKTKKTIPKQQQKKSSNIRKTSQTKEKSNSKSKKAESVPKSYEYGSLGKSTLSNLNSSTINNKSASARKRDANTKNSKFGKMIMGKVTTNINVKDKKQVKNAKAKLNDLFSVKKQNQQTTKKKSAQKKTVSKSKEETEQEEKQFTNLLDKINNVEYNGYPYDIQESDYFEINGKKCETILTKEEAAIKKCEEIFNSIEDKKMFFDKDFGSLTNDGGKQNKKSLYSDDAIPAGNPSPALIEWYPLDQICEDAKFFDDGTESNDVVQGSLGDCWFISALSVMATKDYLLRGEFSAHILDDGEIDDEENVMMSSGVYPPIFHSFRRKGIFCFRFFKNFGWKYVIIDNRLPCQKIFNKNQVPTLLYGKCRSRREFWVPLIEKAYAKLHGSYKALVSGFIDDGLVDLTGLSAKKIMIEEEDRRNNQKMDELWKTLMEFSSKDFGNKNVKSNSGKVLESKYFTRNKSMMGCSVDPTGNKVEMEVILENQHTGILAGHAYSILDCFEIPKPSSRKPRKSSRLLRIRNPWGRKEWVGKWADDSEEVIANEERIRDALREKYKNTNEKISVNQEDGTFIMCFSDFRRIFNKLFICVNFPPHYIGIRYHGSWTESESGGLPIHNTQEEYQNFGKNPQFYLRKENSGKIYISLLQKDGRLTGTKFPFPNAVRKACLLVFKTKGKKKISDLNNLIEKTLIVQRRDLNLELDLDAGEYIIMASTLNKGEYGDFCIEIYTEDELTSQGEEFNTDNLKHTRIEGLGKQKGKVELISNDRVEGIEELLEDKKSFILAQFKNCLQDDDDVNYQGKSGGNNGGGVEEEEEIDYDEF